MGIIDKEPWYVIFWRDVRTWWEYYVLGRYHCDTCPYCWEEHYYYDGDCDAGCNLRKDGELMDTCRRSCPLVSWIFIPGMRRRLYAESHRWDDIGKCYAAEEFSEVTMLELLDEHIFSDKYDISITYKGVQDYNCTDSQEWKYGVAHEIADAYERKVHPFVQPKTKRERFKDLLKECWEDFKDYWINPFKENMDYGVK